MAKGLVRGGLAYAERIGAEVVQVFVANPRAWAAPVGNPAGDEEFRVRCAQLMLPVFVHAPYLVNLGSPDRPTVDRSTRSLRHSLSRGRAIGAQGVVVHTGSAVVMGARSAALRQVRDRLLPLLDELPDDGPTLLLEPTAGQGQSLCASVKDLEAYFAALDEHPRVGVCLDTCHAFAAGHDLAATGGVRRVLDLLLQTVGPGRLRLVHANDAKDACGSSRDRHESIGKGQIGEAPFAELFGHRATRGVPIVVETPGGEAGHSRDVALLKDLRDG